MAALMKEKQQFKKRLLELQEQSIDEQANVFGRRFVFGLGERYSEVFELAKQFKEAVAGDDSAKDNKLSPAGAAGLLQHTGGTRTAQQRKQELNDVDVDGDGMMSFTEFLLLHFKVLILKEHFAREDKEPDVDLSNEGIGLIGVGDKLVEELFNVPQGIDPELEAAMREFSVEHAKRQAKIEELEAKVAKGGVKALAAKNELEQLKQADQTEVNAVEARIAAAVKKAVAKSKKELAAKQAAAEEEKKAAASAGRSKLAERAAAFGKRVSQRLTGN